MNNWSVMYVLTWHNLTHWGRVRNICVDEISYRRRQAIIWTNAGLLSIKILGKNLNEIVIKIQTFSFKKMHSKISSGKWRPFCLGLNVLSQLTHWCLVTHIHLSELDYSWYSEWLVAYSEPSHDLNQWWLIVNWNQRNTDNFESQ